MRAWGRASTSDYAKLDLRAHALLSDIPLHDVWQVELPGSGPVSMTDVRALMSVESLTNINPIVNGLFRFRAFLGRIFALDEPRAVDAEGTLLAMLPDEYRQGSLVEPGSVDGPFRVLYVHPAEAVGEIRNTTVHAFSVQALEATDGGHRLYWAIYVAPVGRITALYMAAIDPFRRWLIYPAVLRHVHRAWTRRQV